MVEFVTLHVNLTRWLRELRTRGSRRRPLHLADATRDGAICQDLGADGKWSRLSHLGSSDSVGNERAAAVQ